MHFKCMNMLSKYTSALIEARTRVNERISIHAAPYNQLTDELTVAAYSTHTIRNIMLAQRGHEIG